ncbi:MAG: hypothetical protein LIO79_06310 [Rikenellaceae bacterium]|nr:hypothetical protein [Rikenellaceae bacterium]
MAMLMEYMQMFRRLNVNRRQGEAAPHKAVMMLAVMEEVCRGNIGRVVPICDSMEQAFIREWKRYVGHHPLFNPIFATPFFHLDYEPFWHLIKSPEYEEHKEYSSMGALRRSFLGASIDLALYEYMLDPNSALMLKRVLIEKYLPSSRTFLSIAAEDEIPYGFRSSSDASALDLLSTLAV